ncbi:unnamed protein product [Clonostachys rosea]|uniref:Cupin type-2 domain-containing protein n=1 Tax=Bionectria ochroleuca TaxID=29856 RepID=A0ABY6V221_BIOOC|nr:unnamed protein product [Clonostachys rosea]
MERVLVPPSASGKRVGEPYIVESFGGENIYLTGSPASARYVVTGKESENKFTILTSGGAHFPSPVPFHYHKYTHHDFLCVKGQIKVWLNDRCKILNPGDYASVAPGAIHGYQFLGDHTELFGIITPAGFEGMFRSFGQDYTGPMWPDVDIQKASEKLKSGVKSASTEFDVIPVKGHSLAEPEPWGNDESNILPGSQQPYFLQNGTGPSAVLGGTVIRPYVTGAESGNAFSLGTIEGSDYYETQVLSGGIQFPAVDHCLYVSDGFLEIKANGSDIFRIGAAEVAWLPAGTEFDIRVASKYVKFFVYSQPGGLVDLFYEAGKDKPHVGKRCMLPRAPTPFDRKGLLEFQTHFNFAL